MVVKYIINGVKVHGPPYTKAEEADFYSRQGVATVFRGPTQPPAPAPDRPQRPRTERRTPRHPRLKS